MRIRRENEGLTPKNNIMFPISQNKNAHVCDEIFPFKPLFSFRRLNLNSSIKIWVTMIMTSNPTMTLRSHEFR
jgi:hypothetical protein